MPAHPLPPALSLSLCLVTLSRKQSCPSMHTVPMGDRQRTDVPAYNSVILSGPSLTTHITQMTQVLLLPRQAWPLLVHDFPEPTCSFLPWHPGPRFLPAHRALLPCHPQSTLSASPQSLGTSCLNQGHCWPAGAESPAGRGLLTPQHGPHMQWVVREVVSKRKRCYFVTCISVCGFLSDCLRNPAH